MNTLIRHFDDEHPNTTMKSPCSHQNKVIINLSISKVNTLYLTTKRKVKRKITAFYSLCEYSALFHSHIKIAFAIFFFKSELFHQSFLNIEIKLFVIYLCCLQFDDNLGDFPRLQTLTSHSIQS